MRHSFMLGVLLSLLLVLTPTFQYPSSGNTFSEFHRMSKEISSSNHETMINPLRPLVSRGITSDLVNPLEFDAGEIDVSGSNHQILTRTIYTRSLETDFVEYADVNNDTISDIITGSQEGFFVIIDVNGNLFANYSTISFVKGIEVINIPSAFPQMVIWGVDTIQVIEIITGNLITSKISLSTLNDVSVADMTGDGIPEIAYGLDDGTFGVIHTNGTQYLPETTENNAVTAIRIVDINGDLIPDIVYTVSGSVFTINGDLLGELYAPISTGAITTIKHINVGNFTGSSGNIVVSSFEGIAVIDVGNQSVVGLTSFSGDILSQVDQYDVNSDGLLDLVLTTKDEIYAYRGTDLGILWWTAQPQAAITHFEIKDMNIDGDVEIMFSSRDSTVYVYNLQGQPAFPNRRSTSPIQQFVVADINNDFGQDLIIVGLDGKINVRLWDTYIPILKRITPPKIPLASQSLEFKVQFSEPSLKTIRLLYTDDAGGDLMVSPATKTLTTAVFKLPPQPELSRLEYAFVLNDTYGNTLFYPEDDVLSLRLFNEKIFSVDIGTIKELISYSFQNGSGPFILAGSSENGLMLLNGSDGSIILQFTFGSFVEDFILGDFNDDGDLDVAVLTDFPDVHFINLVDGSNIYPSVQLDVSSNDIATGHFTSDNIVDVLVGTQFQPVLIDGSTGTFLSRDITLELPEIQRVVAYDLDRNDIDDILVAAGTFVYFISSQDGNEIYSRINMDFDVADIILGDTNNDGIDDIFVNAIMSYILIDGATGTKIDQSLGIDSHLIFSHISAIAFHDYDNDTILDSYFLHDLDNWLTIVSGSNDATLAEVQIDEDPLTQVEFGDIQFYDNNLDGVDDIVLSRTTWEEIHILDGLSLVELDSVSTDSQQSFTDFGESMPFVIDDFDNDGLDSLLFGSSELNLAQPTSVFTKIYAKVTRPLIHNQGVTMNIEVELFDVFDQPLTGAITSVFVYNHLKDQLIPVLLDNSANGTYSFVAPTESWQLGKWSIYPIATLVPFDSLTLESYTDVNDNYIQKYNFLNLVESDVDLTFEVDNANSSVTVQYEFQDEFSHFLTSADISVQVVFNQVNQSVVFDTIQPWKATATINTTGMSAGLGVLNTEVSGQYILTETDTDNIYIGLKGFGARITLSSTEITKGEDLEIIINPVHDDEYKLTAGHISVFAEFDDAQYNALFANDTPIITVETSNSQVGDNIPIIVRLEGNHGEVVEQTFFITVLPQFPDHGLASNDQILLAGIIFILAGIFMLNLKLIYNRIKYTDKDRQKSAFIKAVKLHNVEQSSEEEDNKDNENETRSELVKLLKQDIQDEYKRGLRFYSLIFLGVLLGMVAAGGIIGWYFVTKQYLYSFLLSFVLLALIVILYFFIHFRITYRQLTRQSFRIAPWLSSLPIVAITFGVLALSFEIGQYIPWFKYYLSQDVVTVPIIGLSIFGLFWDVGIVSFSSGFVLVVLTAVWDTRGDIRDIDELERKLLNGHFPKDPDMVFQEIASQAGQTFVSLSRSFTIWLIIILYSVINSLLLYPYLELFSAVLIPVLLSMAVFFREQLASLISGLTGVDIDDDK